MSCGINRDPWPEKYIVADIYLADIQNDTVIIGVKIFPYRYVTAIVTAERGLDPEIFSGLFQQFPKISLNPLSVLAGSS